MGHTLETELRSLIGGTGVTSRAIETTCPLLRKLHCVRDTAASERDDDCAVAALVLVEQAVLFVDQDEPDGAAARLFGLAPGYRGQNRTTRESGAADVLGCQPATVKRSRGRRLAELVAARVTVLDRLHKQQRSRDGTSDATATSAATDRKNLWDEARRLGYRWLNYTRVLTGHDGDGHWSDEITIEIEVLVPSLQYVELEYLRNPVADLTQSEFHLLDIRHLNAVGFGGHLPVTIVGRNRADRSLMTIDQIDEKAEERFRLWFETGGRDVLPSPARWEILVGRFIEPATAGQRLTLRSRMTRRAFHPSVPEFLSVAMIVPFPDLESVVFEFRPTGAMANFSAIWLSEVRTIGPSISSERWRHITPTRDADGNLPGSLAGGWASPALGTTCGVDILTVPDDRLATFDIDRHDNPRFAGHLEMARSDVLRHIAGLRRKVDGLGTRTHPPSALYEATFGG